MTTLAVPTFPSRTQQILDTLRQSGQLKHLQTIEGPMDATVKLKGYGEVACFCSNNYLGLANHPEVVEAGIAGIRKYGAGTDLPPEN
jgi:glycine C-acetyltransferase